MKLKIAPGASLACTSSLKVSLPGSQLRRALVDALFEPTYTAERDC